MNTDRALPLSHYMQYQMQIYLKGMQGEKPRLPVSPEALEKKAASHLPAEAFDYIAGGAGSESTLQANLEAFQSWKIVPRMLTDVSARTTAIRLFDQDLPSPLWLAPIGVLSLAHPEAEVAVAKAAVSLRIPQIVSTVSSRTMEEIAEVHKDNPHWFQLYWGQDPEFTQSLLSRAERAGYSAIVVTLDTRIFAWRERDIQNAYLPFLYNEGLANYLSDPVFLKAVGNPPADKMNTLLHFARCFSNPASTWKDLEWLRASTRLPLIVKGILDSEDARRAIDHGVDGIIVSNHGGRQMDGGIAALDCLRGVCEAVGHQTAVLFDSGIRRGADVFKAMALGAQAVGIGRPYAYGLALAGMEGVREVLGNLLADTDLTLGLAGCNSWEEVSQKNLSSLGRGRV